MSTESIDRKAIKTTLIELIVMLIALVGLIVWEVLF